jgi:hypothetical protein
MLFIFHGKIKMSFEASSPGTSVNLHFPAPVSRGDPDAMLWDGNWPDPSPSSMQQDER